MVSKKREFKVIFLRDTEVTFLDYKGRKQWYGSDYWHGTTLVVSDILSGNHKTILVECLDGETGVLETEAVKIE